MTPEQYFDHADAAAQASALAEQLSETGVTLADISLTPDGQVNVRVDTVPEAAAVRAAGAEPSWITPTSQDPIEAQPEVHPLKAINPGSKYVTTSWHSCTLAFWGYNAKNRPVALTAGHCHNASGPLSEMPLNNPWTDGAQVGNAFGQFAASAYGEGFDSAIIAADSRSSLPTTVRRWAAGGTVTVDGVVAPVVGAKVCKSGARTGWTCGTITAPPRQFTLADEGSPAVSGFTTDMCSSEGDSGSPVLVGRKAVGIISFGSFHIEHGAGPEACSMEKQVERVVASKLSAIAKSDATAIESVLSQDHSSAILTGVHPMTADSQSILGLYGDDFRLAVNVPAPKALKATMKSAKRAVVKGKIALPRGAKASDYRIKVTVKGKVYKTKVKASGEFKVQVKAAQRDKVTALTFLAKDNVQKSANKTVRAR
jgi:hypothetical protein